VQQVGSVLLLERFRVVIHGGKPSLGCTDSRLRMECMNRNLTGQTSGLGLLRVAASSNQLFNRTASPPVNNNVRAHECPLYVSDMSITNL
jgi:hypothetical protein